MKITKFSFSLLFKVSFRIILVVLILYYISANKNNYTFHFISNGTIILLTSLLPDILCFIFKFKLSNIIDFIIQFFIFMSLFIGKMYKFYSIWPLWDFLLHWISGIILGLLGLTTLKLLVNNKIYSLLSPIFVCIFIFMFSVTGAVIWEFWEFAGDQLFGFDSQLFSLVDTMSDMIIGSVGGFIAAILVYFLIKNNRFKFLNTFINGIQRKK